MVQGFPCVYKPYAVFKRELSAKYELQPTKGVIVDVFLAATRGNLGMTGLYCAFVAMFAGFIRSIARCVVLLGILFVFIRFEFSILNAEIAPPGGGVLSGGGESSLRWLQDGGMMPTLGWDLLLQFRSKSRKERNKGN